MRASADAATPPAIVRLSRSPPATRAATRKASTIAKSPPARATTIQSAGGIRSSTAESGPNTVVKTTGSGFQDGPPVVSSVRWPISRPHTSHAHGS